MSSIGPEARAAERESDRRAAVPAALAAVAEAGIIYVPVQEVVKEISAARGGPLVVYPVFVGLFVAGVVAAAVLRRHRSVPAIAATAGIAIGVVQGIGWGRSVAAGVAGGIVLALLVALRAVTLSFRDWRVPVGTSFLAGSGVLLAEVAIGGGITGTWHTLLPVVVPQFFLFELASRAASVRLDAADGLPDDEERGGAAPDGGSGGDVPPALRGLAPVVAVLAVIGALIAAVWVGGGDDSLLRLAARGLLGLGVLLAVGFFYVTSPLLVPLAWLADHVIDLKSFIQRLENGRVGKRLRLPQITGHVSVTERIVQTLILLGIVWLLVWTIRRRRRLALRFTRRYPGDAVVIPGRARTREHRLSMPSLRIRRELPAATIRRWYAEVLLELEAKGLPKAPSRTPAEFAGDVGKVVPDVRSAFERLTRAYEDVRYGDRQIAPEALKELRSDRVLILDAIRAAQPFDRADAQDAMTPDHGPA